MKLQALAITTLAAAVALPSHAELSANIGVTSDYVWRGVTQTAYLSAAQGGIDYANDSGFFAGTWISNTAFGSSETDLYLGFGGEAGDFGYSATFNYYMYPGVDGDADFGELLLDGSFGALSFGLAYTVVSELDSLDDEPLSGSAYFVEGDLYYYLGFSGDFGEGWSGGATYGIYDFDSDGLGGVSTSYGYFELSVAKDVGEFGEFSLTASKADEEANMLAANADQLNTRIGWSKSF